MRLTRPLESVSGREKRLGLLFGGSYDYNQRWYQRYRTYSHG